jgi:hypothetical protein
LLQLSNFMEQKGDKNFPEEMFFSVFPSEQAG